MAKLPQNPMMSRWTRKSALPKAYNRSRKQEDETAARLGGRKIPASGSRFRKADAELPDIARIECKATSAKSFRVTKEMIRTVEEAGMLEGQVPVIDIEFLDNVGKTEYAACVMKRTDLIYILRRLADAEGRAPNSKRDKQRLKHHDRKLSKRK